MKDKIVAVAVLCLIAFGGAGIAFAHGGEIHVGGGAKGPVKLSAEQEKAIGLKTAMASRHAMESLLDLRGEMKVPQDHQADVTVNASGNVKEVDANVGDAVTAGTKLALVQGRLIGSSTVGVNAPIGGVVDARNAVIGQAVEPGTALFHISDRSTMIAVGKVYEEDLGKIKLGQDVHVRALAYPAQAFSGQVTRIEPNLDPLSRTVKVWVLLENPGNILMPNMFARMDVVLGKNDAALAIPNDAVLEANGEKFVFVRDGDSFNRVDVTTGVSDDGFTEIIDGLVPGDEVATQGSREIYTMWLTGGKMEADE